MEDHCAGGLYIGYIFGKVFLDHSVLMVSLYLTRDLRRHAWPLLDLDLPRPFAVMTTRSENVIRTQATENKCNTCIVEFVWKQEYVSVRKHDYIDG